MPPKPKKAVDVLGREAPAESDDERITKLTRDDAKEQTWERIDRHLTEQIKLTRDLTAARYASEKLMRDQLEVARQICDHAAFTAQAVECLPRLAKDIAQLLDVLVGKRTNGHTDLQASAEDAEGTKAP